MLMYNTVIGVIFVILAKETDGHFNTQYEGEQRFSVCSVYFLYLL